jgi:hypothetical protein
MHHFKEKKNPQQLGQNQGCTKRKLKHFAGLKKSRETKKKNTLLFAGCFQIPVQIACSCCFPLLTTFFFFEYFHYLKFLASRKTPLVFNIIYFYEYTFWFEGMCIYIH